MVKTSYTLKVHLSTNTSYKLLKTTTSNNYVSKKVSPDDYHRLKVGYTDKNTMVAMLSDFNLTGTDKKDLKNLYRLLVVILSYTLPKLPPVNSHFKKDMPCLFQLYRQLVKNGQKRHTLNELTVYDFRYKRKYKWLGTIFNEYYYCSHTLRNTYRHKLKKLLELVNYHNL